MLYICACKEAHVRFAHYFEFYNEGMLPTGASTAQFLFTFIQHMLLTITTGTASLHGVTPLTLQSYANCADLSQPSADSNEDQGKELLTL